MRHTNHRNIIKGMATSVVMLLVSLSSASEVNLGLAHQLFIVDHSGSMGGQYEWISKTASNLQANQDISTQYGLMEFSRNPRPISLDGNLFGNIEQFNQAVNRLKRGGGVEDGYFAIDDAISQYSIKNLIAPHIVLITDEHRTSVNTGVDVNSLSSKLAESQLPITVIVNVRFYCDDKRPALGMDSRGLGIVLDPIGTVSTCSIGELSEFNETAHSVTDYVDLALSTGGSAWDMYVPRSGDPGSYMFAQAFAQIHGATIERQLEHLDAIPKLSYSPKNPKVGDVITFDASASRTTQDSDYINSWQWDFNSDQLIDMNGSAVAHAYTKPGIYEITLTLSTTKAKKPYSHSFEIKVNQ